MGVSIRPQSFRARDNSTFHYFDRTGEEDTRLLGGGLMHCSAFVQGKGYTWPMVDGVLTGTGEFELGGMLSLCFSGIDANV